MSLFTKAPNQIKFVFIVLLALPVTLVFQNCGKVSIQSPEELEKQGLMSVSKGSGQFCVPSGQTLETVYVTNLNARLANGKLVADSDGDGLSDVKEDTLGISSTNRRSNGRVLDSICQKVDYHVLCENLNLSCTGQAKGWGLNDCDVEALQLDMLYDHPKQGLDTDKDGIPDYLEVRMGTFPNISDGTQDPDHDYRTNSAELEVGSDPSIAEQTLPEDKIFEIRRKKLTASTACAGGQMWEIEILNMPIIPVKEFVSAAENQFSHAENENIVAVVYKTRPFTGGSGNARVYTFTKKIEYVRSLNPDANEVLQSETLEFSSGEFNLEGEVLP